MKHIIIYFLLIQTDGWKYRGNRACIQKVQITQNNVTNEISLNKILYYYLTYIIILWF